MFTSTAVFAASANATTIVGIVANPPTTAGGGATSTRSGLGTFHIYAADNDNLGITSYNLTMGPLVTASNNRSPVTTVQDGNGDTFGAGFGLLRTASNAPQMQGSQPLPGSTPYLIQGMGQAADSFANIAATRGAQPGSVVGPTTSAGWGHDVVGFDNYSSRKWLFLGEGTWNTSMPFSRFRIVSAATITAFADANFTSVATTTIIPEPPEPASVLLLCLGTFGGFGLIRRRCVNVRSSSCAPRITPAPLGSPGVSAFALF